jgi:hypothetical protein
VLRRGDVVEEDELRINLARGAKREKVLALIEQLRALDGVKQVDV